MKKNHRHSENNVVSNTENDEEDPLHEQPNAMSPTAPNDDSKKHQRKSHPQQNNDTRSVCLEGTQHRSMAFNSSPKAKDEEAPPPPPKTDARSVVFCLCLVIINVLFYIAFIFMKKK
eukprot:54033_1